MTFTAMVAQPPPVPDDPGGRGEDFGKSSPVGLLVLLVFLVAVVFLARSMTKHLKRVPASFDPPAGKHEAAEEATEHREEKNGASS
ncbi:hypothetical protein KIPE111705_39015 [Kibdelosporangium persicum]|uniref:Preprotein translocase subunit SecG n=1 Tax=Kibdelosporangium persicum TaxID=2698649 RepID=A0ABX2F9C2_9PSEU|nr:hypothetical protein [Kibdelosporangium persicum]NRN67803.1 Preprotein translocase subunit SecG [Kibdelosporangium persicum]